jgi:hypothetical protein
MINNDYLFCGEGVVVEEVEFLVHKARVGPGSDNTRCSAEHNIQQLFATGDP